LIACLLLLIQLLQLFHRYSGREQEQKSWRYGIFGPNEKLLCGVGTKQVAFCSGCYASNPGIYIRGL